MNKRDGMVGALAGLAAVITLVICAYPLDMSILASLAVAALVGAAALLVSPGGPLGPKTKPSETEAAAINAAKVKLANIKASCDSLPASRRNAKEQLNQIYAAAGKILAVVETDPNKFFAAEPFLNQCMTPVESLVSQYTKLVVREVDTAKDFLTQTEEGFPSIVSQLHKWYEQLHINDMAALMKGTVMVEMNLPNVNLKTGGDSSK